MNRLSFLSLLSSRIIGQSESGFISSGTAVKALAVGVIVGSASYIYLRYSAYKEFHRGLDRWCEEGPGDQRESRYEAARRMKECYSRSGRNLDLSNLNLTSLPPEIGQLTSLKTLDLQYNSLESLPPEIGYLKNLQDLNLLLNKLQTIPREIGELENLVTLNITANHSLETLPPEIGNLGNLKYLYIADANLQSIPREIGRLTKLEKLNLDINQLQEIPSEIGGLVNLQWLNLAANQLINIPLEIGRLENLQLLDLHDNQIVELPEQIGELGNLIELNLDLNALENIPPQIGGLQNLESLNLSQNLIDHLPEQILSLPRLQFLTLSMHTIERSSVLIQQLRARGARVGAGHGVDRSFVVDLEKLKSDPIALLIDLDKYIQKNFAFPRIAYRNSEGIDAGGLSRDFTTRIFQEIFNKDSPILPILEWEEGLFPIAHSDFDAEDQKSHELYQAVGRILGAIARRDVVIGSHFHPLFFQMLFRFRKSLEEIKRLREEALAPESANAPSHKPSILDDLSEDLSKLPLEFSNWENSQEYKTLLEKMLAIYFHRQMDAGEEVALTLAKDYLKEEFADSLGIYQSREEVLQQFPAADKIIQAAAGILAIGQGMRQFLQNSSLNLLAPEELQARIEGYASQEAVENSLSWEEPAHAPQNDQTKEFIKRWIREADPKMLSEFLFAATGSSTLVKGKKLQISFYFAEGPMEGAEWFAKYHTCNFSIQMPRNYPDYETFKKMLEGSIHSARFGFQAR